MILRNPNCLTVLTMLMPMRIGVNLSYFYNRIEAFGGPKEVGETVIRAITGSGRQSDVKGTLVQSSLREDSMHNTKYYELEYRVESPSFQRHNMAVCCARGGRLFTLNAQAPESAWPKVKLDFYRIADSFKLTSWTFATNIFVPISRCTWKKKKLIVPLTRWRFLCFGLWISLNSRSSALLQHQR